MGLRDRVWRDAGVEGNLRLTASLAFTLLILLAIEGMTILAIGTLLSVHIFVGFLLVPPVILKIGSTGYRFIRYYTRNPAYRRRGAPEPILRLLGPVVVVSTVVLLASGIGALLSPPSLRLQFLSLHIESFVIWFLAMSLHVIAHLMETFDVLPRDWSGRRKDVLPGGVVRRWTIAGSLVVGVILGSSMLGQVQPWMRWFYG